MMRSKGLKVLIVFLAVGFFACSSQSQGSGGANAKPCAPCAPGSADVLGSIDGKNLTDMDLLTRLTGRQKGEYMQAKVALYRAQRAALDEYFFEQALEIKASQVGKSKEEYFASEVEGKADKVSDKDAKEFYDKLAQQAKGSPYPLPPYEQLADRIKEKLSADKSAVRKDAVFSQLQKEFSITYNIAPVRFDVGGEGNPLKGSASAPVTIVDFSGFECPACKAGEEVIAQVLKAYKGKVNYMVRDFPISAHKRGKISANAARCAGESGKYWQMHDKLFATQREANEWTHREQDWNDTQLEENAQKKFIEYGKTMGLSKNFEECVMNKKYADAIEKDLQLGFEVGVSGTPTFFINGLPLDSGVPGFEAFKKVIDAELARTK